MNQHIQILHTSLGRIPIYWKTCIIFSVSVIHALHCRALQRERRAILLKSPLTADWTIIFTDEKWFIAFSSLTFILVDKKKVTLNSKIVKTFSVYLLFHRHITPSHSCGSKVGLWAWTPYTEESPPGSLTPHCPLLVLFTKAHGCVWLLVSLWTLALQTPPSMKFSRQEYGSGSPFPPPGDLPKPGTKPTFPVSPALVSGFFTTSAPWESN